MPGTSISIPDLDLRQANTDLADKDALQIVKWASQTFQDGLVMTSSFGAQAAVMLHLCTRVVPDIPVIWIDTGFLPEETYRFANELAQKLTLNLKIFQSRLSPAHMTSLHGRLWESDDVADLNRYDQIRKVEPLHRALRELKGTAWLTGVRAQQSETRAAMDVIEKDGRNKVFSVRPILRWTTRDVHEYLMRHDLDYHPLYYKGYKSIGDWHSTRPVGDDEDERAGRFHGLKSECGIHLPQTPEENESMGSAGL